jgi:hypothetical protein
MEDIVVHDREESPGRLPFYSRLDYSCPNHRSARSRTNC